MAGTLERTIKIKIDTTDARVVDEAAKKLGMLSKSAKSLASDMGFLTNAFKGWLGFQGIKKLSSMADDMQNVSNRLKIVTGSTEGAAQALDQIAGVADRTNQSISETGDTFTRMAIALKGAKVSTEQVTVLTELLINTFRVAGSTTAETTATIVQLSQAFSLGKLRGQELRSVMSQNATLAGLLKEKFGGNLFDKAEKGLISVSSVMEIMAKHQKEINDQADKLAPTFEQTLTKSLNTVSLAINKLNIKYELSSKFADLMKFAIDNLSSALVVLGGYLVLVAVGKIPALMQSLAELRIAMNAFALTNPFILALTAVSVLGTVIYLKFDNISKGIKLMMANAYELNASLKEWKLNHLPDSDKAGRNETTNAILESLRKARDLRSEVAKKDMENLKAMGDSPEEIFKKLIDAQKAYEKTLVVDKVKKVKEVLSDLNKEFLRGAISVGQYNEKLIRFDLFKLVTQFKEGKIDIFKFAEGLKALDIEDLNRKLASGQISYEKYFAAIDTDNLLLLDAQLKAGKITLEEYNTQVNSLKLGDLNRELASGAINLKNYKLAVEDQKFQELNDQLRTGKINLQDYNEEILKLESKFSESSPFTVGVNNYIKSVGTVAEGIAKGVERAFGALENSLVAFVKTGKLSFADLANSIIDDLIRIQIRMALVGLISNISGAFAGAFGGGEGGVSGGGQAGGWAPNLAANGGVMTDKGMLPLTKYANGGIAKSPQMAIFGEGRKPEAYVPLPDGKNIPVKMEDGATGDSYVTVQINMQTGEENTQASNQKAKQLGKLVSTIVASELIKQKRPGGLLAA